MLSLNKMFPPCCFSIWMLFSCHLMDFETFPFSYPVLYVLKKESPPVGGAVRNATSLIPE